MAISYAEQNISKITAIKVNVTYVYDGDTVKLRPVVSNDSHDEFKLRLTDIDAPERNQSYGLKSRRALMKLCKGENVIALVEIYGIDKYQRSLGKLKCNGVDASHYLAERGLAWFYAQYSSDTTIEKATENARKLALGLWADEHPIPPWDWRRNHSHH